jgi:hypothetical protein
MWNVLQEEPFIPQCDVQKQDQVLMDLSHLSNVGYDRQSESLRQ